MFDVSKAADLSLLVLGGDLYWAFPFGKCSLVRLTEKGNGVRKVATQIFIVRGSDSLKRFTAVVNTVPQ